MIHAERPIGDVSLQVMGIHCPTQWLAGPARVFLVVLVNERCLHLGKHLSPLLHL